MTKPPPATDATPEEMVRALARQGTSLAGRGTGRTPPDASPSPRAFSADHGTRPTVAEDPLTHLFRQRDSRSAARDWTVSPARHDGTLPGGGGGERGSSGKPASESRTPPMMAEMRVATVARLNSGVMGRAIRAVCQPRMVASPYCPSQPKDIIPKISRSWVFAYPQYWGELGNDFVRARELARRRALLQSSACLVNGLRGL